MNLARTQRELYRLFVKAPGAQPALAARLVKPLPPLTPLERVEVYAGQYPFRMHDALHEDFPALENYFGEKGFWRLVRGYTAAYPSEHHDIGRFGRKLVRYLGEHRQPRPDLVDLARLEWARVEAFWEADAEPVGREALKEVPSAEFGRLRLALVPSVRILALSHDAVTLWRALDEGKRPPRPRRGAFHAVAWRKGYDSLHLPLTPPEAEALSAAAKGRTLARVLGAFAEQPDGARAGFSALAHWVDQGMVARVIRPA